MIQSAMTIQLEVIAVWEPLRLPGDFLGGALSEDGHGSYASPSPEPSAARAIDKACRAQAG
jgi:hypothetical protein